MGLNVFDDQPDRVTTKSAWLIAVLAAANVAAWGWAWIAFAGHPALMGTALLAWVFGLRHAFDADHIAAIDNTVRKLMENRKAPVSSGFFFSMGHSTIVILASAAVAATAASVQTQLETWHIAGGTVGTAVSALFLLVIGAVNLVLLAGVWSSFVRVRRGEKIGEADLNVLLADAGLLARLFRPLFKAVGRSWHLYPIGFLFGLGFDTATEVGLLGISASQAASGLSGLTIMVFPALFTAGMSLMDTADSAMMTRAYGWAFADPLRKLWYNLTVTAASVVVALFIGGIEVLGLVAERLEMEGGFWDAVEALNGNLTQFGFVVVGIFAASWMISGTIYRAKGFAKAPVR